MPYADKTQLIADYIPEATSTEEIAAVGRILDNVSAFVDSYCKRPSGFFAPSAADPSMKRVRGEGMHYLRLPVHVFNSITEIDGESFASLSASIYESEKNGWLYFESEEFGIEEGFAGAGAYGCRRFTDNRVYKITARWGYLATPLPIVEAVRLIVARIWQTQRGTIGQTTAEGFIQEKLIPQAAKDLLKQFIKKEFAI